MGFTVNDGQRIIGWLQGRADRRRLRASIAIETGRWASALALAQREHNVEAYAFVSNDYYGPGILPDREQNHGISDLALTFHYNVYRDLGRMPGP